MAALRSSPLLQPLQPPPPLPPPAAGKKRKVTDEDAKAVGRRPSPYNIYMAQELARVKAAQPNLTHKEAFTVVAAGWKDSKENPKNGGTALVAAAAAAPASTPKEAGTKRKRSGAVPTDAMAVTYRKFCERTCDLLTDVLSNRPTSDDAIVDALRTSLNGDGDTFEYEYAVAHGEKAPKKPKNKGGEKQKAGGKKAPKANPEVLAAALKVLQRAKWDVFTAMTRDGSSGTMLNDAHLKQLVIHKGLWATLKSVDSNPKGPGRMLMVRELTKVSGLFADDAARMAAP